MLIKRFRSLIYLSLACVFVSFLAFFCTLLVDADKGDTKLGIYLISTLFWVGLIGEQVFFWCGNALRRRMEVSLREGHSGTIKGRAGVLSFMKCPEGIVADILMFAAAAGVLLLLVFDVKTAWVITLFAALLFVSVNLHCILNGINYLYIKAYRKYLRSEEHEKNEQKED